MKKTTRNIFTRIAYLLFAGLFMTLVISAKIQRDQQVVQDLHINIDQRNGHFFIVEEDVRSAVRNSLPADGSPMQTKDLKDFETVLEEIPAVRSANVFVNNNGQLSIEVKQRTPFYRVMASDGRSYYVDGDGYKFPTSRIHTAKVPLVTGHISDNGHSKGEVESEMHRQLLLLFTAFHEDPFWNAQFGQVDVTSKGEFELVPRFGSHIVQIGNADNLEDKLLRLRIFYREALPHAGWDTYKTINVKFKDQVVCKK